MLQKIRQLIFGQATLGLKPLPEDKRDLGFWNIFGSKYTPRHTEKRLKIKSVKLQFFNTCGWVSSTSGKEIDEDIELDERVFVMAGKLNGFISGDGFSNLRDNEKVLQKFGIAKKGFLPTDFSDWQEYSDYSKLSHAVREDAAKHRSKSYLRIYSTDEIYKAIDNGRHVKIGISWYRGFNMGGGFKHPYIIDSPGSLYVGGHAMLCYGYIQNYYGKKVFIIRNSFGSGYGDKGDLYITPEFLQKQIARYGAFVNYDFELDIASWLVNNSGKNISDSNGNIYLIEDGKKRKYPDMATFLSHNQDDKNFIVGDDEYLSKVEDGADMKFFNGSNYMLIYNMIKRFKDNTDRQEFSKYFSDLFA